MSRAGKSETGLGKTRGGEGGPLVVCSTRPGGRSPPRTLPLWQTTVASGVPDTPLLSDRGRGRQLERFPEPFPLPPEYPERPVGRGKGRR